jgi:CDGSH-type Zn-finger protein
MGLGSRAQPIAAHATTKETDMADPIIADKAPMVLELEPGSYFWCHCGRSKNQPYCDGAHQGTAFTPLQFTIDDKKKYALCMCKHTAKPPMCDGSHKKL